MCIDDQTIDEYYTSQYSKSSNHNYSDKPYRPAILKSSSEGVENKVLVTDDICDSDNFDDDDGLNTVMLACMAASIACM